MEIYATGVFLEAIKCTINGKEEYRWIATRFEDDSYMDGEYFDPDISSDKLEFMNREEWLRSEGLLEEEGE